MPMPASPTRTLVDCYSKISFTSRHNVVVGFSRLSRLATGRGFLDSDYAFNAYLSIAHTNLRVSLLAIISAQYLSFPHHGFAL